MWPLAKALAARSSIPLGRHLLGSTYHLLHEVSSKLLAREPIGNLGGPWWFINLWLNFYFQHAYQYDLKKMSFPSDQPEEEPVVTRRCTSYGEAVLVIPSNRLSPSAAAE